MSRDWLSSLPYGDSFRFVDEIVLLDLPRRLISRTDYSKRNELIAAHGAAGVLVVPGVLLAEQAAQSAYVLGRHNGWLEEGDAVLLGRLNCIFEAMVPGHSVVEAEVTSQVFGPEIAAFKVILAREEKVVARVSIAVKNLKGIRHEGA